MRLILATAILAMGVAPAVAGGRLTGTCPAGYTLAFDSRGNGQCVDRGGRPQTVAGAGPQRAQGGRRVVLLCPYPHRPSDSVFSGGSGYIIKDDVRRARGC